MPNVHIVPSDAHVTEGECWCDAVVIEGENGNVIFHEETPDDA